MAVIVPIRVTLVSCEGCEDRDVLIEALRLATADNAALRAERNRAIDEREALYRLLRDRA